MNRYYIFFIILLRCLTMPLQAMEQPQNALIAQSIRGGNTILERDSNGILWIKTAPQPSWPQKILELQKGKLGLVSKLNKHHVIEISPSGQFIAVLGDTFDGKLALEIAEIKYTETLIGDLSAFSKNLVLVESYEHFADLTVNDFKQGTATVGIDDKGTWHFARYSKPYKKTDVASPQTVEAKEAPKKQSWFSSFAAKMRPVVQSNYWNIVKTYAASGTVLGSVIGFKNSTLYAPLIGLTAGSLCGLAVAHLASKLCDTYTK